jgi:hypothetical protein
MNDPLYNRYRYISFKGADIYRRFISEQSDQSLKQQTFPGNNQEISAHGSYGALLFDSRWKEKREEILKRDANQCVLCKSNLNVQVHHRQYHFIIRDNQFKPPWDYEDHLLITLCESCHKRGHNKYKVPTITI